MGAHGRRAQGSRTPKNNLLNMVSVDKFVSFFFFIKTESNESFQKAFRDKTLKSPLQAGSHSSSKNKFNLIYDNLALLPEYQVLLNICSKILLFLEKYFPSLYKTVQLCQNSHAHDKLRSTWWLWTFRLLLQQQRWRLRIETLLCVT